MMMAESLSASQQKGRQTANDAISAHRPEIEAAQKKYQEEHAPKTTPAPGNGSATPSQASIAFYHACAVNSAALHHETAALSSATQFRPAVKESSWPPEVLLAA